MDQYLTSLTKSDMKTQESFLDIPGVVKLKRQRKLLKLLKLTALHHIFEVAKSF